jgi:hypothetical protein
MVTTPVGPSCPSCGEEQVLGYKFCTGCGIKAEATTAAPASPAKFGPSCGDCGEEQVLGYKFCTGCGTKVTVAVVEPAAPLDAEPAADSWQLTSLTADSTDLEAARVKTGKEAELRTELAELPLGQLKKRARAEGIDEDTVEDVDDAADPKAAIIGLLMTAAEEAEAAARAAAEEEAFRAKAAEAEAARAMAAETAAALVTSEKDAKLAHKLGQLQPFIAVFPQECLGQLASFGPT